MAPTTSRPWPPPSTADRARRSGGERPPRLSTRCCNPVRLVLRRPVETKLSGPIAPAMLRLALPTIGVLVVQTLVGVTETYFVSFLGTEALAGVALVFPVLMLVQMMSNGGIGGGVASAVAQAVGANRGADAQALAWHAMLLACGLGLLFTTGPEFPRKINGLILFVTQQYYRGFRDFRRHVR